VDARAVLVLRQQNTEGLPGCCVSRADAGRIPLQPSEFNLIELAREASALLDVLAEEKNQVISVEGDAAVEVHADRLILRQALINLIDNAVKYSPRGGSIRVRVAEVPGQALGPSRRIG
jgi:signal transduction histidine kinase